MDALARREQGDAGRVGADRFGRDLVGRVCQVDAAGARFERPAGPDRRCGGGPRTAGRVVIVPPVAGAVARLFVLAGVDEVLPLRASVTDGLAALGSRGGG
jgi:hypothetical protein